MPDAPARRRTSVAASALAVVSVVVALWPYAGVIQLRTWILPILFLTLVLTVIGAVLRRLLASRSLPLRVWLTALVQLLVLLCLLTMLFGRTTAVFGVFPTLRTARLVPYFIEQSISSIWFGSAPLAPSTSLVFVLTAAFGLTAILLDHLLAHGRVVLAAVTVAVVGGVPMIITRSPVDIWWFIAFAVLVLVLLRRSVRSEPRAPRRSPVVLAAMVGVVAIGATVFFGPSLPLSAMGVGPGGQVMLNPTLDLGEDLREPRSFDVVTLATSAERAPYLRLATLSEFDGEVWQTDEAETQPLREGFGQSGLPDDLESRSTSIRMQDVAGRWLPVPYPATAAYGLSEEWRAMPANRSIVSTSASAQDQDYTVASLVVDPTLEEMRGDRRGTGVAPAHRALPEDVPSSIAELAREVTADATTDYDRLAALQSWFRSQFRYSLSTPVEEGFDGSGAEAVGQFLEVRSGYCVHFAAAFALMARSLDMPSRIVVGFLPGTPTGERRGEEILYSVKSDDLHAWPEVYFERWGWIAFEPTASRGTPTQFITTAEREEADSTSPTPAPGATPGAEITAGPDIDRSDDAGAVPEGGDLPPFDARPLLGTIGAILLALLVPAAVRLTRRARRMVRAGRGDAAAAWAELEDTLVDLRIPVTEAESPRGRGIRLRRRHRVDGEEIRRLIEAIERESYAAPGSDAGDLAVPLRRVLRQLVHEAEPSERAAALLLPRSLLPMGSGRIPVVSPAQA